MFCEDLGEIGLLGLCNPADEQRRLRRGVAQRGVLHGTKRDDLFAVAVHNRGRRDRGAVTDDKVYLAVVLVVSKTAILALKVAGEDFHRRRLECLGSLFSQIGAHIAFGAAELGQHCWRAQCVEVCCRFEDTMAIQIGFRRDMLGIVLRGSRVALTRTRVAIEHHALPPRLVQHNLHPIVVPEIGYPVKIGHHPLVPGGDLHFEIPGDRCPNG